LLRLSFELVALAWQPLEVLLRYHQQSMQFSLRPASRVVPSSPLDACDRRLQVPAVQ
jgi:hypothetical protein